MLGLTDAIDVAKYWRGEALRLEAENEMLRAEVRKWRDAADRLWHGQGGSRG